MRRGNGGFEQSSGRSDRRGQGDRRLGGNEHRDRRGPSLTPHSSFPQRYDANPRHQHVRHDRDRGGASPFFSASSADPLEDRQRDRKARRRQERQAQKQARVAQHEQWARERQKARQEAQDRRATEQLQRQRKRQRAERAARPAAETEEKRRKLEKASKGKGEGHARGTTNDGDKSRPVAGLKANTAKPSTAAPVPTTAVAAVSSASSLADSTPAPVEVTEKVRRLVNKLTTANVVDLTKELSDYMLAPGVSRASVVKALAQQIERLCRLEAGPLSTTGTLPFAGLLRGMQLLHGDQVGAELVERLALSLKAQLTAAEEAPAGNMLMVLAQLYLLHGVDVLFVMSLLRTLLREGTRFLDHSDTDRATASAAASSSSPPLLGTVAAQAVCACACGLVLLRACGEKLLKESPTQLEASLQEARRASVQMRDVTGTARFAALVEVMGDIASGHTRRARRTTTEEAAPVEAMLEDLCSLLPGHQTASTTQRRTIRRLVLTASTMSGLTWAQVTSSAKPPQWYRPGVMMSGAACEEEDEDKAAAATDGTHSGAVLECKEGKRHSDKRASPRSSAACGEREQKEEVDVAELKRERIARIRAEEKAISGQRLNTEHKREIFRCIATATDDLECFTMLMYRDPGYTCFHDVCAVLLQCTYQERKYNPYYAQVLMRFCSAKPACAKPLQFAIWDRFKSIRIEGADVIGYFNFACCISDLMEHGVYHLGLLRGLDLENTNKTIGLFTRILLLRLIFQLPASRLTQLFFGGDGRSAHDLQVDTSALRRLLTKFMSLYFLDEKASKRWLPSFYEVVAAGTSFDVSTAAGMQTAPGSRESAVEAVAAATEPADGHSLQHSADRPTSMLLVSASAPARDAPLTPTSASSAEALVGHFMKRVHVVYKALKQGIL
ncbi:hypothetical protein LSCM1_03740 [Leishmania martiniquensis]|uniref:MI domain-containing protein n=1 Tax=Leishmania martiniquensis TaxID=1580590 RepID=A0A836KFQ2_9TRYP|nr:hypothetical protein LSCM1_03740 [Leishmania martiniquensis]